MSNLKRLDHLGPLPKKRIDRPDPLAQLEGIIGQGWSTDIHRRADQIGIHARKVVEHHVVSGPTLADAIDALARKVGG